MSKHVTLPEVDFIEFTSPESLDLYLTRREWVYRIFGDGSVDLHHRIHATYDETFETNPIAASGEASPLPSAPRQHSSLIAIEGHPDHGIPGKISNSRSSSSGSM